MKKSLCTRVSQPCLDNVYAADFVDTARVVSSTPIYETSISLAVSAGRKPCRVPPEIVP